jgi:MutS-like protein
LKPTDDLSTSGRRNPREEYTRHLESRRGSLAAAIRRHVTFGNLRVAALAAGLAAAYVAFARGLFSGWWLLAPTAAFFWTGARLERAVNARARLGRAVAFYERALARLNGRWAGTGGETGARFLDDGHLYARDLDLFGEASLFELLSCARTRIGEETLAAWLKEPAGPEAVRARQEAVVELAPRTDLREDFAVLGEDARTGVHAEALAVWGEQPGRLESSEVPAWAWPLSGAGALAAVGLLAWLAVQVGLLQLGADTLAALRAYALTLIAICGAVAWRFHARTAAILRDVRPAAHDLGLLAGVVGRLEAERFAAARLTVLRADLDIEGQPPSRRIARLNALVDLVDSRDHLVIRLVGPLLLWDLHLVYAIERWRRTSGPAVRRWLAAVGEMEALSSLAGYHYEHPDDVFPDLGAGTPCFDGEDLGHPLLSEAITVRNDVRLAGELRMLVVSGSNMSGKTTLLRTVGVNAVLAQAGAPVRARRLRLTPLEIGASIRIQDSLQAGVSRFYAEITRLGLIMRCAGEAPVLFLIDELLHGTNSHDRRIGAEAIVRGLVERGAIGLVTTHDLALAHVAEALGARGANAHFEDSLEDGRMRFDYRMRPGVVQKSNALALMRSVGLDV